MDFKLIIAILIIVSILLVKAFIDSRKENEESIDIEESIDTGKQENIKDTDAIPQADESTSYITQGEDEIQVENDIQTDRVEVSESILTTSPVQVKIKPEDIKETIKQLKREKKHTEAIEILLAAITLESEVKEKLDPWFYLQLAIIYRKEKKYDDEIAILNKYINNENAIEKKSEEFTSRRDKAILLM